MGGCRYHPVIAVCSTWALIPPPIKGARSSAPTATRPWRCASSCTGASASPRTEGDQNRAGLAAHGMDELMNTRAALAAALVIASPCSATVRAQSCEGWLPQLVTARSVHAMAYDSARHVTVL